MNSVSIAELKARLSQYLSAVRRGEILTVTDRGVPVAEIVPVARTREMLPVTPASRSLGDFAPDLSSR